MVLSATLITVLISTVAAFEPPTKPEEDILTLTSANFSEIISAPGSRLLVSFYAPWCAHSQRLAQEYKRAGAYLRKARAEDPTLVGGLAMVDAVEEVSLASSFGVRGYPTLVWFADGKPTEYRGARREDSVVDWVVTRGGPLVKKLADQSAADLFRLSYSKSVIATLSADANKGTLADDELMALEEVCRALPDVRCGRLTSSPSAEDIHSVTKSVAKVVVYRAIDDAADVYPGDLSNGAAMLLQFVVAHALPPVVDFSYATQLDIFESSIDPIVMLLTTHSDSDATSALFTDAALALRGHATFTRVDLVQHGFTIGRFFGHSAVAAVHRPSVAIYLKNSSTRYLLPLGITSADVEADVRRALQGEVPPLLEARPHMAAVARAESIAIGAAGDVQLVSGETSGDTSDVVELQADTFERRVRELGNGVHDVALLFYAPWCLGCDSAVAGFAALAHQNSASHTGSSGGRRGLRLAQLDVSAIRVAVPQVSQLPSAFLIRANASGVHEAVRHKATSIDLASLQAFLESESSMGTG